MAINVFRNKRFGPGGGTRRLHQIFPASLKLQARWTVWGRNRIDERGKGLTFARHSTTVSGYFYKCQR